MSTSQIPDPSYLCQALRYENGKLFWLVRPRSQFATDMAWKTWNTKYAHSEAGYRHHREGGDRWLIRVCGKLRRRSKIVWMMHHGTWPDILDHHNRDTLDDRIGNLRIASGTLNNGNAKVHRDNKSGLKGIYWNDRNKRWMASIQFGGKWKYLGSFADKDSAHAAYCTAAKELFGAFACNG